RHRSRQHGAHEARLLRGEQVGTLGALLPLAGAGSLVLARSRGVASPIPLLRGLLLGVAACTGGAQVVGGGPALVVLRRRAPRGIPETALGRVEREQALVGR